jgi:acyl-CoA thioester hydrolase
VFCGSGRMDTFETKIRVRYEETDQMGVVYYAKYFVWFEVARTEFLRKLGLSYSRMEEEGYRLMVVDACCKYKAPCRYDDLVGVQTWISDMKNTSLVFEYKVSLDKTLLASGRTTHVFTDLSFRPVKIPLKLKETLKTTSSV